jgi:hypothetical protein
MWPELDRHETIKFTNAPSERPADKGVNQTWARVPPTVQKFL